MKCVFRYAFIDKKINKWIKPNTFPTAKYPTCQIFKSNPNNAFRWIKKYQSAFFFFLLSIKKNIESVDRLIFYCSVLRIVTHAPDYICKLTTVYCTIEKVQRHTFSPLNFVKYINSPGVLQAPVCACGILYCDHI